MRMKIIAFLLLFVGVLAQAQTLLVSDIDDTVKVAHVPDKLKAARWAFKTDSRFAGMTHLYSMIEVENEDLQIVYLSNAPNWLMGRTHRAFLERGLFPEGLYINRTNYDSSVHKIMNLRALLDKIKPQKVILIGDNGERDPVIYAQIANEYRQRGIDFFQYIRIAYNSKEPAKTKGVPLKPGQIGFVSPVELSLELEKAQVLSAKAVEALVDNLALPIIKQKRGVTEGEVAFPEFVECRDLVWRWDDSLTRFSIMNDYKNHIVARCKIRP